MTQEDKELLLKDLSTRLPYGVKLLHIPTNEITALELVGKYFIDGDIHDSIEYFKPYLFRMPSMTVEQENEFQSLNGWKHCVFPQTEEAFDWLNKNHFDYRRLIEKGLALDATNLRIYE